MTDDTIKISAFFVTLNEAEKIEEAIRSVSTLDEIIVVDSGSTDGTIAIAEKLGARVIHQEWLGFAQQKAFALEHCSNEWCLNLDGDEIVPTQTLAELQTLISQGRCDLIRFPIEDIFLDSPMHPWSRKRSIVRAFKKSMVAYPTDRLVHENIRSNGVEIKSKNKIIHYGYNNFYTFMEKQNKYALLGARTKKVRGLYASLIKLALIFPLTFIKVYLFRKLFLSGVRGFIQSVIEAMYAFLKEAYLYEASKQEEQRPL